MAQVNNSMFTVRAMAMPEMPTLHVGPYKTVKTSERTLHFVSLTSDKNETICFESAEFYSFGGVVNDQVIGYPDVVDSSSIDCPRDHLRSNISYTEFGVEGLLTAYLKKNPDCGLSNTMRTLYMANPVIRPTFKEGSDIYWAKLGRHTRCFDWEGKPIKAKDMGPGRYQFVLRCTGIYIGQHGESNYVASLNMRVIQIRHQPLAIEGGSIPKNCMMVLPRPDSLLPPNAGNDDAMETTPISTDTPKRAALQMPDAIDDDANMEAPTQVKTKRGRKPRLVAGLAFSMPRPTLQPEQ